ncbi:MAG: site-specific integrase [Bryobacteraceae bacterium]
MALNAYRRHGSNCRAGRAFDERTYEPDELRRIVKKCFCPIYASGTLGGKFKRANTEKTNWDDARAVIAGWETRGSWSGPDVPAVPVVIAAETEPAEERITIDDAIAAYLTVREGSGIKPPTLGAYRAFAKQLRALADLHGYRMLDQFTVRDIDTFYANWKLGPRRKAYALGLLRGFFRFCLNREWIAKSPVSPDLKAPVGANRAANKAPFTDEELERIIRTCDRLEPVAWENHTGRGRWTGEDVKDFIWVLAYTGLRISDVGLFHISRLRGNELFLRARKNGGEVFTWIPDWLRDRLHQLAKERGPRPFVIGTSDRLETVTDLWRRKINRVFELAGRFEERPTPHRFRHTFARILLQRGVPVADVAELLGDDEKTVRQHYARWVPERQARLTSILQEAFADKPRPGLIVLGRK